MIAKLQGRLDSLLDEGVVLDVGGVGYMVFCSSRTQGRLPPVGESVVLLIETHIREDHIHLYGFAEADERALFRLLLTVQGVGARVGLSILSALPPRDLRLALAAGDKAALSVADGVGPKLAARIASELSERVGTLVWEIDADARTAARDAARQDTGGAADDGLSLDAISALVHLGYGRSEAYAAVARASSALGDKGSLEALIRGGLKELGA